MHIILGRLTRQYGDPHYQLGSDPILHHCVARPLRQTLGSETSFRQLKYTVGMIHLHSKRLELILQEIFSAFLIFNFTQATVWDVDTAWGKSKYKRYVNFSDAVYLCCQTLQGWFLNVLPLLERKLLSCRPDLHYSRPSIPGNRISPMYVPSL